MTKLAKALIYMFVLLYSTSMCAQVTIGSDLEPNNGSLLDLKVDNSVGSVANSTKGIILPRVALKYNHMYQFAKQAKPVGYEGFIIYNTTSNKTLDLCPGINVWNGDRFVSLTGRQPIEQNVTMEYPNGDSYTAIWIGDHCGYTGSYWTRVNLHRHTNKNDRTFASPGYGYADDDKPRLNPGYYSDSDTPNDRKGVVIPTTGIPDGTITYGIGDTKSEAVTTQITVTYRDFAKEFGLLYNYSQANEACANGWRLPSEDDWDEMIKGLHSGATATDNVAGEFLRRDFKFYRAQEDDQNWQWGEYETKRFEKVGFDAVPAGMVQIEAEGSSANGFAYLAHFWTSASFATRMMFSRGNMLYPESQNNKWFISVRCMKD